MRNVQRLSITATYVLLFLAKLWASRQSLEKHVCVYMSNDFPCAGLCGAEPSKYTFLPKDEHPQTELVLRIWRHLFVAHGHLTACWKSV